MVSLFYAEQLILQNFSKESEMHHRQLYTAPDTCQEGGYQSAVPTAHHRAEGRMKTAVEIFDGRVTELYSDAHGVRYVHAL